MDYPKNRTLSAELEISAVMKAFEWAKRGDLIVLLVYAERKASLALIERLKSENWQAGEPVSP